MRISEPTNRKGWRKPRLSLEVSTHAGLAVLMIMLMAVPVMMIMIVVMIVPATAALTMRMVLVLVHMMSMSMMSVSMLGMRMLMMGMSGLGISPALGVEGRFDQAHFTAQTLNHRLDHMIMADAQALARDLHRKMPVTKMPRETKQVLEARRSDLGELFSSTNHFHHSAVFELQRIACAERHRLRQIEQEIQSPHPFHRETAAVAIVEIQHDSISRVALPVALGENICGPDHGETPVVG